MKGKSGFITIFELELTGQINVARHGADPAHFRADDSDRLFLDHSFKRYILDFARLSKERTARAAFVVFAKGFLGKLELIGNGGPLEAFTFEQVFKACALFHEFISLGDKLHLFEFAQRAQPHV